MKNRLGWWFPDEDTHFVEHMDASGVTEYQAEHRNFSLQFVKNWDVAVDVGGHVGLWSRDLSKKFNEVFAFEPRANHRECFLKNVLSDNVTLHAFALGDKQGKVNISYPIEENTGSARVDGEGDIVMKTLDEFNFTKMDYLKIDVEGYELFVLQGGVDTLLRCKPIINIEQKPLSKEYGIDRYAASKFLLKLGAKHLGTVSADFVFGWE